MGHKYKKKESFFSKTINFFATLLIAYFIGTQVIGATGNTLRFAQISDVHLATDEQNTSYKMLENSKELFEDAVKQVNVTPALDFVMFTGDMVNMPKTSQMMEFISVAKNINVPWYIAIGNHDVDFDGKFTKSQVLKLIGGHNLTFNEQKPYYAFKPQKGYKAIVLDTMIDSRVTSNGELPKEQLDWLDKEVAQTPDKDVILMFSHVPVMEPYPSEHHKLLNATEVLKHLYGYNRPIIWFAGHYHGTKIIQDGKLLFVNTPSLVTYPNAFRVVNINSQRDKILVDFYFKETNLKDVQTRSKLRVIFTNLFEGEERDRVGTYELER